MEQDLRNMDKNYQKTSSCVQRRGDMRNEVFEAVFSVILF